MSPPPGPQDSPPRSAVEDAGADLQEPLLSESLTPREVEVLALVCDGQANEEIAAHLGIALATVKYHLVQIYWKLGVMRRTQAVALAVHLKIVTPDWLLSPSQDRPRPPGFLKAARARRYA